MKKKKPLIKAMAVFLILLLGAPQGLIAQSTGEAPQEVKTQSAGTAAAPQEAKAQSTGEEKPFKQEELDQLLAPIALYPDSLLTQVLMASTYPLEIVQANRWAKENKDMKGDALAKALEEQPWDPSVRSLVNFPDVLAMMSEKLDLTQKLGDAFLAQQKEVMDTIQNLRKKAEASGNLKTSEEQKVIVEKETIIIESANPQVIYVPSYNPTVVYGSWWYPAYPPYPYYPPGYGTGAAFVTGVAIGAAWGYAWGHANWHGGDVNINIDRNTNINNNIDRDKYRNQGQGKGQGKWQHDASHRGGVAYKDQGTAQKYNRGTGSEAAKSREAYRGKAETGRQDISRGGADQMRNSSSGSRQGAAAPRNTSSMDRGGTQAKANKSAFGSSAGGAQTRSASSRGNQSMSSSRGGGGGARGGGGGRRR
ncbi:MAG: DUF3300 domain-containing protein [Desulfobulbales bacterium]